MLSPCSITRVLEAVNAGGTRGSSLRPFLGDVADDLLELAVGMWLDWSLFLTLLAETTITRGSLPTKWHVEKRRDSNML